MKKMCSLLGCSGQARCARSLSMIIAVVGLMAAAGSASATVVTAADSHGPATPVTVVVVVVAAQPSKTIPQFLPTAAVALAPTNFTTVNGA